jgi:GT2 family glycosyltransferase
VTTSPAQNLESAVPAPANDAASEPLSATFGIIARRRIPELDRLIEILLALEGPGAREIVIGVETPGRREILEVVDERGVRWLELPAKRGVGYNRNRVLDAARHEIIFGVDDDCEPQPGWYEGLLGAFADPTVHGAVGCMRIPPAGFVGDSISALGFPAGGNAGYETMFQVDEDGTTYNLPGGNCALRCDTLREIGGYDETMTFGGEDTELAYHLTQAGKRLVWVCSALMEHPARTSLREFVRWQYVRGRAKRQFALKVPVKGFVGNRLRSMGRIFANNITNPKIVLIAPLLVLNLLVQQFGFVAEMIRPTPPPTGE